MQSMQDKPIPKEKSCPSCHKHLRENSFSFDENLNMYCGFCGGIVFSVDVKSSQITSNNTNQQNKFNSKFVI